MLNNGASQSDSYWCPVYDSTRQFDREGADGINGCYLSETCAVVSNMITALE